jgi:hypothetical protein
MRNLRMRFGRPWLPDVQSGCKTAMTGLIMRVKSEWTPGGITLWLIAAIVATLVVCSQIPEAPPTPPSNTEVEIEVVE